MMNRYVLDMSQGNIKRKPVYPNSTVIFCMFSDCGTLGLGFLTSSTACQARVQV